MTRQERADRLSVVLDQMYPDATCELNYQNEYELLVAVVLSAQTTDKSVNHITPELFKRFPDPKTLAVADLYEIEMIIKQIGLYRNKSKMIKKLSRQLVEHHQGRVPRTKDALIALPGVGPKTANVVISVAFNQPAIAVDTHVERIAKRLYLANQDDSVYQVEKNLMKLFPIEKWSKLHHQMIYFGRYHCKAKNPDCQHCMLTGDCRYYKAHLSKNKA